MAETNQTARTPHVALIGPTPESIARALEAQRRERATFNRETGVRVDGDGSLQLRDRLATALGHRTESQTR